jgi:hypothetical protein
MGLHANAEPRWRDAKNGPASSDDPRHWQFRSRYCGIDDGGGETGLRLRSRDEPGGRGTERDLDGSRTRGRRITCEDASRLEGVSGADQKDRKQRKAIAIKIGRKGTKGHHPDNRRGRQAERDERRHGFHEVAGAQHPESGHEHRRIGEKTQNFQRGTLSTTVPPRRALGSVVIAGAVCGKLKSLVRRRSARVFPNQTRGCSRRR